MIRIVINELISLDKYTYNGETIFLPHCWQKSFKDTCMKIFNDALKNPNKNIIIKRMTNFEQFQKFKEYIGDNFEGDKRKKLYDMTVVYCGLLSKTTTYRGERIFECHPLYRFGIDEIESSRFDSILRLIENNKREALERIVLNYENIIKIKGS